MKTAKIENDISLLRERLLMGILEKKRLPAAGLSELVRNQDSDGSWPDIDYSNTESVLWEPNRHLTRLGQILLAFHDLRGESQAGPFAAAAHRGLAFWFEREPLSVNWWFNQIGVPMELGWMLLLLGPELTEAEKCAGLKILSRSGWFLWKGKDRIEPMEWTGANLLWMARILLMRALLESNEESISDVCRRVAGEIRIANEGEEGIQSDYSFHQHGPLLFNGGYGASFASECLSFVALTAGTSWEFPAAKRELLAAFLLDGQQWMRWGHLWDHSVCDRTIARPASPLEPVSSRVDFSFLGGKRIAELDRFTACLTNWPETVSVAGNRYFPCSDFMVHRREGYYTSLRMSSIRTRTSECCNGEGKLSHHVADGATFLYKTGEEYHDIFPIWDWRRVPGTTCVQREDLPIEELQWQTGGPLCGGVSDGRFGVAAQALARPELKAQKAWFYFDEGWVCLGSDIRSENSERVLTSVEQCWSDGPIYVAQEDRPVEVEDCGLGEAIWHCGVGYLIMGEAAGRVRKSDQTGAWTRIGPGPDGDVTGNVFSLWIDHGPQPSSGEYAYAVLPEIAADELLERSRNPFFRILSNTPLLQAVEHSEGNLVQAVFWQPGEFAIPGRGTLRSDQPCLVLLKLDDKYRIEVGSLERNSERANVTFDAI